MNQSQPAPRSEISNLAIDIASLKTLAIVSIVSVVFGHAGEISVFITRSHKLLHSCSKTLFINSFFASIDFMSFFLQQYYCNVNEIT